MVMIARDKRMDCSNHISLPLTQKYLNMKITKLKFWKNLVELFNRMLLTTKISERGDNIIFYIIYYYYIKILVILYERMNVVT